MLIPRRCIRPRWRATKASCGWADYGWQTAVAEYLRGYRKLCGFT